MSSPEPERPEYERRVVRHLWRTPVEGDLQVNHLGRPVRFEEVRLEGAGSEAGSVAIPFRASDRPGCLFGRREDAVAGPVTRRARRVGGYGLDLPRGRPRDPALLAEGVRVWCHDVGVKG